ncbi:hypothetical protein SNE510_09610 [Streptomyces sp. NE5-10]|nr:hypothetical protein SNE510_09610 [Streptomyces sp. NE5-10]
MGGWHGSWSAGRGRAAQPTVRVRGRVPSGEDPRRERVIDLDEAAAVLAGRRSGWQAAGPDGGRLTGRDAEAPWPRPLESEGRRLRARGRRGPRRGRSYP